MVSAPWIILFSPFIACVLITLFSLKRPKLASAIALAGILISLILSVFLFLFHMNNHFLPVSFGYRWIDLPGITVEFGYLLDELSLLMLLIVTGVGSCVFIYSTSYMRGDESYPRYFAYLSLFAFSMLGIVLANNLLMLFIFWELVAVSSYLLIGFWFQKPSAADAGNKAFIVNRVADFGLVMGIIMVWFLSGLGNEAKTFSFIDLKHVLPDLVQRGLISPELLLITSLLLFCGVIGKSAQFPLYIWLPDAMEGPTPVSALIHAATMVAAGVYLMARSYFLVELSPEALNFMAYLGMITAFLAALLAVVQNDIKKILAYSTVSQLGYMVMALGLGSSVVAMYHLTTHAFFKALLFLGSGAMIHALHTQDIWEMGDLKKQMPVTAWTFIIGTLALCGIWPLSGFFSKDEILVLAHEHNLLIFVMALLTAGLTAFYMSRACWVAILGPKKAKKKNHHDNHHGAHGHESVQDAPLPMKLPLIVLTILAVIGGFIGIPKFLMGSHAHEEIFHWDIAIISSLVAIGGLTAGTAMYARLQGKTDPLKDRLRGAYTFIANKYYLDEIFLAIANFFRNFVAGILFWFDWNVIIKKGVDGTATATAGFGSLLRRLQTGAVQLYALVFGFGIVALVYFFIFKGAR